MTTVVNFYGGPGVGKSTMAAYAYYLAKKAGKNAELVREYVKDWVWEGRKIGPFDQMYIMGKHIRKETLLYDRVDLVFTDSPICLPIMYARLYSPAAVADGVEAAVREFYKASANEGHTNLHLMLRRTAPYRQEGRYQTENEARGLDRVTADLLIELGIPFDEVNGDERGVQQYLQSRGLV